jgi:hypothetical protein
MELLPGKRHQHLGEHPGELGRSGRRRNPRICSYILLISYDSGCSESCDVCHFSLELWSRRAWLFPPPQLVTA